MTRRDWSRPMGLLLTEHGMLLVLIGLCGFFSLATIEEQSPTGAPAARHLAGTIAPKKRVVIVARDRIDEDARFAETLDRTLQGRGVEVVATVLGDPAQARRAIAALGEKNEEVDVFATTPVTAAWSIYAPLSARYPSLAGARIEQPATYRWPVFLKPDNLLNVANQIAVIAIIAIGMTLVIITRGIDLSVGSLIALSSVIAARLIRDHAGGTSATLAGMVLCSVVGILACSATGYFSGWMVTFVPCPSLYRHPGDDAGGRRSGLDPGARAIDQPGSRPVYLAGERFRPAVSTQRRRADVGPLRDRSRRDGPDHPWPVHLRGRGQPRGRRDSPACRWDGSFGRSISSAAPWPGWAGWSWHHS